MKNRLIVDFGDSDLTKECNIRLHLQKLNLQQSYEYRCKLPANLSLLLDLAKWKTSYDNQANLNEFQTTTNKLTEQFQQWLTNNEFLQRQNELKNQLSEDDEIEVIFQFKNNEMRRLPWHLWDLFTEYPNAFYSFARQNFEWRGTQPKQHQQVRILAFLSSEKDVRSERDGQILANWQNNIPDTEVKYISTRQELETELLNGYDILLFSTHSRTTGETGQIKLNENEIVTIKELEEILNQAIENGLKLVIFNSCDGLGLANDLAKLHISRIIVMKEKIPNLVAIKFLDYFLEAFSQGKSLFLAVKQANQQLRNDQQLPQFIYVDWLPALFTNPEIYTKLTWEELRTGIVGAIDWRLVCWHDSLSRVTTNTIIGKNKQLDDIFVPLALRERKKLMRNEQTRNFKFEKFVQEVLEQRNSPKSKGKRLVIVGEPGAGKTTLLQKITHLLFAKNQDIVIWVNLADLKENQSLETYLLNTWLRNKLKVTKVEKKIQDDFINWFNNNRVWLLLDGADEMSVTNPLQSLKTQINGWVASARVIVTCRLNVWDLNKNVLAEDFDIYRNLDFDYPQQVHQFIDKWFTEQKPHPNPPLGKGREPFPLSPAQGEQFPPSPAQGEQFPPSPAQGEQFPPLTKGGLGGVNIPRNQISERLKQELEKPGKERIRDLIKNPLRLTLLCASWEKRPGGALPDSKAPLYQMFTDALYEWKQQIFPTNGKKGELNEKLGNLALAAIETEGSRFRLTHSLVCKHLGEDDSELFKLATDIGWLNFVGVAAENPDEKVYAFFHPTFQEYFAAKVINQNWGYFLPQQHLNQPILGEKYRIFEREFKEIYLLWMGLDNNEQKERLLEKLINFASGVNEGEIDCYQVRAIFLAAEGLSEFKQCKNELVEQVIESVDDVLISSPVSEIRKLAVEVLGKIGSEKAVEPLIKCLGDKDWTVRESAARALEKIRSEKAVEPLIQCLGDEDWSVRDSAEALGKIGSEKVVDALIYCLGDKDSEARYLAAEALGNIGSEKAVEPLIKRLGDQNWRGRYSAAEALGKIGSEKVVELLIKCLGDEDWDIRYLAAEALGKIGSEKVVELLIKRLGDEDSDIRYLAAKALRKIGSEKAVEPLIQCLGDKKSRVRDSAAEALRKIGLEIAVELFIKRLDNKNSYVRYLAAEALGNIGSEKAVEPLIKRLGDEGWSVRKFAAKALIIIFNSNRNKRKDITRSLSNFLQTNPVNHEIISLLWHIAQNLPYPEYYQAWHNQAITTTNLNLSNLPQLLNQALATKIITQKAQIIYIDSSKIINPTQPAAEIYDQILDFDYPETPNGTPTTMAELKVYYKDLWRKNQKSLVFIFHLNSQNFNSDFFNNLYQFDIPLICAITYEQINTPLKQFSATDNDLINNIIKWIEKDFLER